MKVVKPKYDNMFESDPLEIKRYPRKYYRLVYSMISVILALLAFSLVSFLIYYMSP